MSPNAERTGVEFTIETDVPQVGGNGAQRREHDKRRGMGTMSRSGAQCACCPTIMTMEDLRVEACAQRIAEIMTAVVVEGVKGKEYRLPHFEEVNKANVSREEINATFGELPFGLPSESTPLPAGSKFNSSSLRLYGLDTWGDLFSRRQLVAMRPFARPINSFRSNN
jgi:adenine-specific DNA methylase